MNLSTPIDVLNYSEISPKSFERDFIRSNKPAIIKGILDHNPEASSWTLNTFYERLGNHSIDVYDDRIKNGTSYISTHQSVPMSTMLDLIKNNESSHLRMFVNPILKKDKELYNELNCPDFFKGALQLPNLLFIGGKGCVVPLHYDFMLDDGLLTHFFGRKDVILIENNQSNFLYRLPFNTTSLLNLFEPDYEKYPGLKKVKGYKVTLNHGDTLFIPSGYWHQLKYVDGSMSIAFRKWNVNPLVTGFTALKRVTQISFDKTVNSLVGNKWFNYKKNKAAKRAIS